jgi:cell division septal protein FtsQ
MVKRKKDRRQPSVEGVRIGAIMLIILSTGIFLVWGVSGYLRNSPVFAVKDIVLTEELQKMDLSELQKIKGQRIFAVDIRKIESRLREKHSSLAEIRVLRRFPDQIVVMAVRRDPFVKVTLAGKTFLADRDGWLIRPADKATEDLVLVKGIKDQRPAAGERIVDSVFQSAVAIIGEFKKNPVLLDSALSSLNVADKTRIVASIDSQKGELDVYLDLDKYSSQLNILQMLLSHQEIDFSQINYIDLRFREPVIGKKKARKT